MPDISKCTGIGCPLKETCYRCISEPNEFRQAYVAFKYDEEKQECKHYWENEK